MRGEALTGHELRYIVENYPHKPTRVIAHFLNMSIYKVYNLAYKHGLKKSSEFLASERSGIFIKGGTYGKRYQFEKGHVPVNKGKKMPDHIKERIKHTWFKKGNEPHNTKFDGYVSVRKDRNGSEYAHIRLSKGKFELLHRFIWIQHNGPIPPGHIVAFKNGNTSDFRLENLELITREQNMLRNTRHNYPPDLQQAIMALNKLKNTIKEYGKE